MSPLLTPNQVASVLNIKVRQVYLLIKRKQILSLKVGRQLRVREDALYQFIQVQGLK